MAKAVLKRAADSFRNMGLQRAGSKPSLWYMDATDDRSVKLDKFAQHQNAMTQSDAGNGDQEWSGILKKEYRT